MENTKEKYNWDEIFFGLEQEFAWSEYQNSLPTAEYSWLILMFDSIKKAVKHAKDEVKELKAHLKWLDTKRLAVKHSYSSVSPTQHRGLDAQMTVWEELIDDTKTEILFYEEWIAKYGVTTKKGYITEVDKQQAKLIPMEQFVSGRIQGRKMFVKCPFHTENTGSFIVYLDQNTWWCYGGCQTGGDVVEFIKKRDNVKYIEAVKILLGK